MFQAIGSVLLVFSLQTPNSLNRIRSLAIVFVALALMPFDDSQAETVSLSGQTMGTTYSVKLVAASIRMTDGLAERIEQRLSEIDDAMSTWKDDSEISRFNASKSTDWFPISQDTLEVIQLALDISAKTEGAFDITAAPLIGLWNFGANSRGSFKPPSDTDIQTKLSLVGYDKIELQNSPPRIRKTLAGIQIDLSAIAKGYAVDAIARLLSSQQLVDFMVEIGGEVIVSGQREDQTAWRIGVEAPQKNTRVLALSVPLKNTAIASSGDYRNFFDFEGVSYSHIIDPRTGRPAAGDLSAISVLSRDCASADAIATAMLVLGADSAQAWCQQQGIAALLFKRAGSGFSQISTNGFPIDSETTSKGHSGFLVILFASGVVFSIAFVALAIGAILKGKCLQGSCGGLANLSGKVDRSLCETCDRRIRNECSNEPQPPIAS